MRGVLRIRSARAPYLRAGLSFQPLEPLLIDIRDLDGARLIELARDPVLSIEMGDEAGVFRPMPNLVGLVTAGQAQMAIDALAAEMPARVAVTDPDDPDALKAEIATMQDRLNRQAEVAMAQADQIVALQHELAERSAEIDALKAKAPRPAKASAAKGAASS